MIDRLIYVVLIGAIVGALMFRAEPAPVQLAARPTDLLAAPDENTAGPNLRAPSAFDPLIIVEAGPQGAAGSGTAFAIDDGVWLTAQHVVAGCGRVGLAHNDNRVTWAKTRVLIGADAALIFANLRGAPLPMTDSTEGFYVGQAGYHVGYPQGQPGEISSQLLGREVLVTRGSVHRREPVLAWAETARTTNLYGSLGGLSGGPALNRNGVVIGVTVAENPRRGRVYTTAPRSTAGVVREYESWRRTGRSFAPAQFGAEAERLRSQQHVAKVLCLP